MSLETEFSSLIEPVLNWAASLDTQRFVLSLLGVLAAVLLRRPLARLTVLLNLKVVHSLSIDPPDNVRIELEAALRVIIVCAALLIALQTVRPPEFIGDVLQQLTLTVVVIALFSAWYKLSDSLITVLNPKHLYDHMTEVEWVVRVARFVIIILGITALLGLWNINISAAITGVGVFGAGLAIAAQDMLRNFFAGMSNVSEKRFVTGDRIQVEGIVDGVVKQIDLRSTTIVGLDRIPRYVPNADLANATVLNLSRRDHRLVDWDVALVLSATNEQVEQVCSGIRKHLATSGDFVVRDDTFRVIDVSGMSPSAVELKIFAYTQASDYEGYLGACNRLTACIRRTVDEAGTALAYPTQSIIVEKS